MPSLGTPKDHKEFCYGYNDQEVVNKKPFQSFVEKPKNPTTLNYTNQSYDFINHRDLNPNCPKIEHEAFCEKLPVANKKGALTKHIDKGRLYAPNFHSGFGDRVDKHEFYRKRQLCGETANIEKSYGVHRFFRKYK